MAYCDAAASSSLESQMRKYNEFEEDEDDDDDDDENREEEDAILADLELQSLSNSPTDVIAMPMIQFEHQSGSGETMLSEEDPRRTGRKCHIPHIGLAMAVISSLFFSLCSLIVRKLTMVNSLEHSTMRFIGVLLPAISIVVYKGESPCGRRGSRLILFLRGVLGSAGLMFQFYAFQHMPLADASVLIFSSPVFVTIFARIFLKEPCGVTQVVSVIITVVGVLLISKPPFLFGLGGNDDDSVQYSKLENLFGALSALCGTICSANVYILIRKLKFLHYAVIMMTFATIGIAMSFTTSLLFGFVCMPCSLSERLYLLLLGIFSFFGQVLLTKALQYEQAGPVSICRTADIVFAFIWQVTFLGEVPNTYSVVGATLVTLSVLVMGIRKWLLELPPVSFARKKLWFLVK